MTKFAMQTSKVFTFQYVSIISDTKIDSYIEALTFTFQYVSIISGIPDY